MGKRLRWTGGLLAVPGGLLAATGGGLTFGAVGRWGSGFGGPGGLGVPVEAGTGGVWGGLGCTWLPRRLGLVPGLPAGGGTGEVVVGGLGWVWLAKMLGLGVAEEGVAVVAWG